ncbi:MAG: hypothetical protein WC480_00590 [Patescibacteria group bacterium]
MNAGIENPEIYLALLRATANAQILYNRAVFCLMHHACSHSHQPKLETPMMAFADLWQTANTTLRRQKAREFLQAATRLELGWVWPDQPTEEEPTERQLADAFANLLKHLNH